MIKPTVGRVVLFTPVKADPPIKWAAIIAHVWSDTCVNLACFDSNGCAINKTSVPLIQDDAPKPAEFYCEWMEYQKGQAAKTEALEAQLKHDTPPKSNR
jgi:hypothetical protein